MFGPLFMRLHTVFSLNVDFPKLSWTLGVNVLQLLTTKPQFWLKSRPPDIHIQYIHYAYLRYVQISETSVMSVLLHSGQIQRAQDMSQERKKKVVL